MQGLPLVLLFVALTFISWGAYGPVLHHGTQSMGNDSLRAFVGVGLAYFVIAVVFPILMLRHKSEKGKWTIVGTSYSFIAGAVGAIGALGVILALVYKGKPVYVMPLVFGFAPIVNTLVTAWMGKAFSQVKPIFIAGIVTAALGAGGVLAFKPTAAPHAVSEPSTQTPGIIESPSNSASAAAELLDTTQAVTSTNEAPPGAVSQPATSPTSSGSTDDKAALPPPVVNPEPYRHEGAGKAPPQSSGQHVPQSLRTPKYVFAIGKQEERISSPVTDHSKTLEESASDNILKIVLSIIMAAFCWGAYGPMLHQGQSRMGGSRLRPFICVGLAYFFIAVAAPLYFINSGTSTGSWTAMGLVWSITAGAAGAIGALGIILAFNAGGKPFYVMPLVFGFAPVINTFITLTESGLWSEVRPLFWISLAVVITGAITVLTNAPQPKHALSPALAKT